MKIVQASVYWKNDKPGGIGLTFKPPGFSPDELTEIFTGDALKHYMRDSDMALGTSLVETYLAQLGALAAAAKIRPLSIQQAILCAYNIMWLVERGFIPNDEFNGVMLVYQRSP